MSDNERVLTLQANILSCINNSNLPLSVKAIVLENALLKTKEAMAYVQAQETKSNHDEVKE